MAQKLKGIKQCTFSEYDTTESADRAGYIWFLRELDNEGNIKKASIYLGNRLYASTNDIMDNFLPIDGDDVV